MKDSIRLNPSHERRDCVRVEQVQLTARGRDHFNITGLTVLKHVAPNHPGGACYQNPHQCGSPQNAFLISF
jgi:hypothetical protein